MLGSRWVVVGNDGTVSGKIGERVGLGNEVKEGRGWRV